MIGVSVVICCYNSRTRLRPGLEALSKQNTSGFQWEIIVVDNNSNDNTAQFAMDTWQNIVSSISFRIIFEPTPGAKYARESGIRSARFDFILFCDDDNRPAPNYVQRVFDIFAANPWIAVVGGMGVAIADEPLPKWFPKFQTLFAVGPPVPKPGQLPLGTGSVYGAGMGLRKPAWTTLESFGFRAVSVDRRSGELSGGHDGEIGHAMRLIGYDVVFDPTLKVDHFMEQKRLSWPYTLALARGSAANFVPFVYFTLLERRVSSTGLFVYYCLKRIVSDAVQVVRLRLSTPGDREESDVMRVMAETSFTYFVRNFRSAVNYFQHIRLIKSISEKSK